LKGKGMPVYDSKARYGDLFVTFEVHLPTKLTAAQKEQLEILRKSMHNKG